MSSLFMDQVIEIAPGPVIEQGPVDDVPKIIRTFRRCANGTKKKKITFIIPIKCFVEKI